jgi:hypothetical protein
MLQHTGATLSTHCLPAAVLATGDLSERAAPESRPDRRRMRIAYSGPERFRCGRLPVPASGSRNGRRSSAERRIRPAGTILSREYKGRTITVTVLRDGFECEGRQYDSLSAIDTQATRTRWNVFAIHVLRPLWCAAPSTRGNPPRKGWNRPLTHWKRNARPPKRTLRVRNKPAGPPSRNATMMEASRALTWNTGAPAVAAAGRSRTDRL